MAGLLGHGRGLLKERWRPHDRARPRAIRGFALPWTTTFLAKADIRVRRERAVIASLLARRFDYQQRIEPHIEPIHAPMQMRPGRATSHADCADNLTLLD